MSTDPAPLSPEEARDLLAASLPSGPSAGPVLLAVSGGPDSVALMHFAADLAEADAVALPFAVATVDHGLRPTSRAEAEAVAGAAAALGLPCHILSWVGPKPSSRLQERARDSRYALLADCALRLGAAAFATAHTLDDQAETVLFRLMRGSGPAGLAGMASRLHRDGLLHLRPLLGIAKARLVATCRSNGWAFADDPANSDPRFARARLRRMMPGLATEGLDAARFAVLARRMRDVEAALCVAAHGALSASAQGPEAHDARRLFQEPAAVRQRALALLLARSAASGRPRLEALERLDAALVEAAAHGAPLRRTLRDVLLDLDGGGRLTIEAAPPRRRGSGRAVIDD